MRRSKKTSKFRVTGLYEGNSPVTDEFPTKRASSTENVSIWWRHHVMDYIVMIKYRNSTATFVYLGVSANSFGSSSITWGVQITSGWNRMLINSLRLRQNGRHFADDMFKCIFLNENVWIPIEISLKFVPKGSINNNSALFQIMAWRRPGNKPLSEPMMVSSLTHICITRPQWVIQ